MKPLRYLAAVLALSVLPATAAAQPSYAGPPAKTTTVATKKPFKKKFAERRRKLLKNKVGLSDDKVQKVEAISKRYRLLRKKNGEQIREGRAALKKLFAADSNDQPAYARALKKIRDAHRGMMQLRDKQFDEMQKVLTPKEQAKLLRAIVKAPRKANEANEASAATGRRGGAAARADASIPLPMPIELTSSSAMPAMIPTQRWVGISSKTSRLPSKSTSTSAAAS